MTRSIRDRDLRLADMREKAERDNHILALGAIAAGAAHELSTPLSTMSVISHEIICDFKHEPELIKQMKTFETELLRCRHILTQLSVSMGAARAEGGRKLSFEQYMQDVVLQWQLLRPNVGVKLRLESKGNAPELIADISLMQVLHNLLNNAADASQAEVLVKFDWSIDSLWVEVIDHGEGFPQYILDHLAEPKLSNKGTGRGLGLYLSYAVITRLDGQLKLLNMPEGGACASITLPRLS